MNIGTLKQNNAGNFIGKIQTATLDLVIGLRAINSSNASAPRFEVMGRTKSGEFIPLGGLWEKSATSGSGNFLQGQIDDPSFDAPLSIALFLQDDGSLNVAWSRPRRRVDNQFGQAGAMTGGDENFAARDESFEGGHTGSPFDDADPARAETAH